MLDLLTTIGKILGIVVATIVIWEFFKGLMRPKPRFRVGNIEYKRQQGIILIPITNDGVPAENLHYQVELESRKLDVLRNHMYIIIPRNDRVLVTSNRREELLAGRTRNVQVRARVKEPGETTLRIVINHSSGHYERTFRLHLPVPDELP